MALPIQNISNAVSAYANAATKAAGTGIEPRDGGGGDFADLVKGAIQEAKAIGVRSEQLSISAVGNKADLNQVVTAVAEAELTLQTVTAVRDKVIEAYKQIVRMPI